jgi:ribosome modulation factor
MKKQKRDNSERSFNRGYRAGITGKSKTNCPHTGGEARNQWISGWREGRSDHWDGVGVSGLINH